MCILGSGDERDSSLALNKIAFDTKHYQRNGWKSLVLGYPVVLKARAWGRSISYKYTIDHSTNLCFYERSIFILRYILLWLVSTISKPAFSYCYWALFPPRNLPVYSSHNANATMLYMINRTLFRLWDRRFVELFHVAKSRFTTAPQTPHAVIISSTLCSYGI